MFYLQINLKVAEEDRSAAAAVYGRYKGPFLSKVDGARSKELLIRDEDVQVLHGFDTAEHANAYLASPLFAVEVAGALQPLLQAGPDVRVYMVA